MDETGQRHRPCTCRCRAGTEQIDRTHDHASAGCYIGGGGEKGVAEFERSGSAPAPQKGSNDRRHTDHARTPDMKTITRSKHLAIPTENTEDIYREACELYHRHWKQDKPLRLLGVTLQRLAPKEESAIQLDLFDYEKQPKKESLTRVMDERAINSGKVRC